MELSDFLDRIPSVLRQNLLAVFLVGFGLLFLAYGAWGVLFPRKDSEDIVFEQAANAGVVEKNTPSSQAPLVVDVSGAVQKPGVYRLMEGQRVQDALVAAGGISDKADQAFVAKSLNLAAKVSDGMKIYIPFVGETVNAMGGNSANVNELTNINTATSVELDSLPGVGAQTVLKIISARPFGNINDLLDKKIVSKNVFDKIKTLIVVQ